MKLFFMLRNLLVAVAAVNLLGCTRKEPEEVLARVGDAVISVADFERQLQTRRGAGLLKVDAEELLKEMVEREVLVQKALLEGLRDDPDVKELMRDVLISKYRERHLDGLLEKAAEVSPEEVRKAYEQEKEKLMRPERVRLALLRLSAADAAEQEAQGQRLRAAVEKAGQESASVLEGFGPLSVEYSEDQESRYRGGEIGWVEQERYPQRLGREVIDAGFALKEPGQISDVIPVAGGVFVVRLLERQSASAMSLEQAGSVLKQRLIQQKQEEIRAEFQEALRRGLTVEVNSERLKGHLAASPNETLPPSIP